jgi:sugar O-acyltransferase (sialic acid O-acetyltransferase NeuD family)
MKLFAIVGVGGFGREVMPLAVTMLQTTLLDLHYQLVFVDKKTDVREVNGHAVMSFEEFHAHAATEKYFNIAVASYEARLSIANEMLDACAQPFSIIAVNSFQLSHNIISEGVILCPYTTITANAKIGKFFHANIYSYVAHDCIIGDYVTFAPNVHCNGSVIIEDFVYAGTGVIIKQGTPDKPIIIGKGAVLGMGAVVTKSVAPFEVVVGNPARPLAKKHPINL